MSPVATAKRIGVGATRPHNWAQLFKFGAVGASGYAVNLVVFVMVVLAAIPLIVYLRRREITL